ncbi:tRNA adenosine(34) deaminase TadA [Enterobacteriaceae endosymbiont of Neohaemonia nigricornis]|uniref:tRNA adenosine(34) deaminase TadA n=1 Tax=Enterobacteriaceae endosymbiont of Neohaemonia nigricornis TaxID=2675792 RepID=UPI001448C1BB|nr:tRNA adenosine(34) deaminase TadA [Enterobacteriaceae endosymbiont of Neohaemonia nigricornis]QJC30247.1 tRNA adenosine(34) deaminase TadA [Enterobacteriaceae endosymbiont of Neohaemonia nigricornis]
MNNDIYWMRYALKLAYVAKKKGEVPVGAVIIKNNKIIAEGKNSSIIYNDPTAHAEIIALRGAGMYLKNYRLLDTTMYVTLEPCIMCSGAIIISRVSRLVFSIYNKKYYNSTGAFIDLLGLYNINYRIKIHTGILVKECTNLIQDFFQIKR